MIQTYFLEKVPQIATSYQQDVEASPSDRYDMGFDMSLSRENPTVAIYDWAKFNFLDDEDVVTKDQWDELYARPDTNWYEGMTQYQAEVIRDEYDYNLKHQIMNNTDAFNFANTAGYFAGALLDPLNFLPWTRALSSSLNWIRHGNRLLNPLKMKNITKADDVIDAVAGSVAGESAIYMRKDSYQSNYDLQNAFINVISAGSIGAGIAGMRKVAGTLKDKTTEETIGSASKALEDGANGQSPTIDGSNPPKDKLEIEIERESPVEEFADKVKNTMDREIDLLNQNPTIKAGLDAAREKADSFVNFLTCKFR